MKDTQKPDEYRGDEPGLKAKASKGGVVMMGSKGVTIVLHFAFTFLMARLLTPEDFGIVAMVLAITVFAEVFKDAGLSAAAIQRKALTTAQQSNLFWLNISVGIILTGLIAAAAQPIAWFYDKEELIPVTLALSLSFFLTSASEQHRARLMRDMRFKPVAAAAVAGMFFRLIVGVYMASAGYGYWAIIWATLAGLLVTSAILILSADVRIMFPKTGTDTMSFVSFGARVMVFNGANFFHKNLDKILIGRLLGADALGHYQNAYALAMYPITAIRSALNVAFPVLSRLQDDPVQYKLYFLNIVKIISNLSVIPLMFGVIWGEQLVNLFLGPGWEKAAELFVILCIAGLVHPAGTMREVVLLSLGKDKKYARWGIFNSLAMAAAFVVGIGWGAYGVAWAYVIGTYTILYPSLWYVLQGTGIRPLSFLQVMFSSVMLTLPAVAITKGFYMFAHTAFSQVSMMVVLFVLYTITVFVTVMLNKREKDLMISLYDMVKRKKETAPNS